MSMERRDWMKTTLAALGAAGLGSLALEAGEEGKSFVEELAGDWDLQQAYTIEVAEAMPAEHYAFKPTEEMRSFGEVMAHIGGSCYFFGAIALSQPPPEAARFQGEATKERIVPFLKESFDYVAARLAELDRAQASEVLTLFGGRFTMSRAKVCHFLLNHLTHHRGYTLPYLRLNGVQPPSYRFTGRNPSPV